MVLYWAITMVGAGAIARSGGDRTAEVAWIIAIMFVFTALCMVTECGDWKSWQRIGFVFVALFVHALLTVPAAFTFGLLMYMGDRQHLVDRATVFWASIPIVVYAMRRSRLFVKPVKEATEGDA